MASKPKKRKMVKLISKAEVDSLANAAFTALTTSLGRPFVAGSRNVRSIAQSWDPLLHDPVPEDAFLFAQSYIPAHFFDRYIYADELENQKTIERESYEKFMTNVLRGWIFNAELGPNKTLDPWLNSVLEEAALLAQRILGPLTEADVFADCGYGPNAATDVTRDYSYLGIKSRVLHGSVECVETFVHEYLRWDHTLAGMLVDADNLGPGISLSHTRVTNLSFVPKKFDKLRTVVPEPPLNMFFQLGIGRVATKRLLKNANICLSTQADVHRRMVVLASRHPELGIATLDWSEASDRQWLALYQRVFPHDWFWWMDHTRSAVTQYKGEEIPLPMMGTMGNGFTFPCQTTLFLCLLRGLARIESIPEISISVFGDDCLVPTELVPHVQRLAELIGWKLNSEKSYWDDRMFRESCGADAYRGVNVRPFMIERPTTVARKNDLRAWLYVVFNGMIRVLPDSCSPSPIWEWLLTSFAAYDLGRINVVPPRFSDASGVRVYSTRVFSELPTDKFHIPLLDECGVGYHFRYLKNVPGRVSDWVQPYYWLKLRGDGGVEARPTPKGRVLDHLERESNPGIDKTGTVPRKRTMYRGTRAYVHSWVYVTDSDGGVSHYLDHKQ